MFKVSQVFDFGLVVLSVRNGLYLGNQVEVKAGRNVAEAIIHMIEK